MTHTNSYISIILFLLVAHILKFNCGVTSSPEPTCLLATRDSARGSSGLQISHNYGPCSPSLADSHEIFLKDQLRVRSINRRHTLHQYSTNGETDHHDRVPEYVLSVGASTFTTEVGFGTPRRSFKLYMDTGSRVTWIKCKPCLQCELKDDQVFDPLKSSSYSNRSCYNKEGDTEITYLDKSTVDLTYACDTIFLPPSAIKKFTFGCGQRNSDDFKHVDGLLGLGQGDLSVMSQTSFQLGKVFTYCLPPGNSSGHFYFGKEAKRIASTTSLKYTPLLEKNLFYYIALTGISVGTEKLGIRPSVFQSHGTVLDSGTVFTRLPELAYTQLKQAFIRSMSKYNLTKGFKMLDTCYNLGVGKVNEVIIPEIVLHFGGGADVKLNPAGVVWKPNNKSKFCLAFAPTSDLTIIGSKQQLGLEVFHDLEGKRIGFGNNRC